MTNIMDFFILDEITKELKVSKKETIRMIKEGKIELSDEEIRYTELDDLYIVSIEGKEKIKKYYELENDKTDTEIEADVMKVYKDTIRKVTYLFTGFGLMASLYKSITDLMQEEK